MALSGEGGAIMPGGAVGGNCACRLTLWADVRILF
jgi:hypothetical protein